jgi:DNA-binding beta-propeller fold protein YncE/mono/diheme cytochrome c family protein
MSKRFERVHTFSLAAVAAAALVACSDGGSDLSGAVDDIGDVGALLARGETLFRDVGNCWDCHGADGQGADAPSLTFGPTAADISYQLDTNPDMAEVRERLQASDTDLVALAVFVRSLAGLENDAASVAEQLVSLETAPEVESAAVAFSMSERDELISRVADFSEVLANWSRRAATGSLRNMYDIQVMRTFEAGEPRFTPEPGKMYWYEATGTAARAALAPAAAGVVPAESAQVIVGDAQTKEVIASYSFPAELRAAVHTTAVTPDGRYVYLTGPRVTGGAEATSQVGGLGVSATLIKADALTLQPVEQLDIGGRLHHAQIFQERLMLVDTFARDPEGLDIFVMDPETNEVLGGVRDEDLGGASYTSFTDDEYIYVLMEPGGYPPNNAAGGFLTANRYNRGEVATMRPFWVAKIDPESWEVVREYPYPGFRANWIVIDSAKENMYVPVGASSYVTKINLDSGEILWTTPTGPGPYGASLNADESEIWVADKGETTGAYGRTMSVIGAEDGRQIETVFSGYAVDHVLLSPNGREMWATSNGDGAIYVFDTSTHEQTHVIEMPGLGEPHGLVFVWYDDDGQPRVVRDQGGFHAGINPALGSTIEY